MVLSKHREAPEIADMTDPQLLAHLITMTGTGPVRAQRLARALLDAHQSLERVLALPGETLSQFPELDEKAAAFLHLIPALLDRYRTARGPAQAPTRFWEPEDTVRILEPYFLRQNTERVCVFCLGDSLELLTGSLVSQGNANAVTCSVPRVLKLALTHQAKSVILAHNHPDGSAAFSKSDLLATGVVAHALSTVDVPLSDHLLLAGGEIISLRALFSAGQMPGVPFLPPENWLERPWPLRRTWTRRH